MDMNDRFSRRQFIMRAALTVGATVVGPSLIPAFARGVKGKVAPSNRIAMGLIGVGGMGTHNLKAFLGYPQVQVVAVCDVDRAHRETARRMVDAYYSKERSGSYQGCAATNDFREVLARGDLDAVMIATPDHWHALIACAAARAGIDTYCEKPVGLTIGQGRILSDTMTRHGRVFQTGSWQRSQYNWRHVCELVRNGRIGKIHTVRVGLPPGAAIENQPEVPVPKGFDYDMWLGPAPRAPYIKARCHYNFRYQFDYSGGKPTDWGAHHHDIAQWALGTDTSGPTQIEGRGEFPKEGIFDTATQYEFTCTYADGARMITTNEHEYGVRFEGSEGWIYISRERWDAHPRAVLESVIRPEEINLYKSEDHYGNFLECVRTRAMTATPAEIAHRSISIAHLGNIAMRLGRKLHWNPQIERFVDDPEADRLLTRPMRGAWQLV